MKRLFNENDPHGSCPIANPAYDSSRTVRAERPGDSRGGYTLVELLVATTLTLFLLGAVAIVFGMVGQTVNESRATLEMTDRLRAVTARLQNDLEGVTVAMTPPIDPGTNQGYFKYIEGPNPLYRLDPTQYPSPQAGVWPNAANTDQVDGAGNPMPDTTVIDHNDIVMFTTRAREKPFVGRAFQVMPNGELRRQAESQVAEVSWFVRGRTLYRRVLLVLPDFDADLTTSAREPALSFAQLATAAGYPAGTDFSFYQFYDLSVRRHRNGTPHDLTDDYLIPNSLGDLTKPENRFAHQSPDTNSNRDQRNWDCPFHPHLQSVRGRPNMPFSTRLTAWRWLGLPTLKETAHHAWGVDSGAVSYPANAAGPLEVFTLNIDGNSAAVPASWAVNPYDLRVTPHPYDEQDPASGAWLPTTNFSMDPPRTRAEEDVRPR